LKSKKIEQGRPVSIKMGYDSVATNLETVFTGRIAEMEMGDVVTLVCQGWKSELINRQVNFYTKNKRNWGPKDLAVLAMQLGDPDGFGQHFPQRETMRILERLDRAGNREQIERVLEVVQPGTQNVHGAAAFLNWVYNSDALANTFDIGETRFWEGLDTRLKNIWYPDISKNVFSAFNWKVKMGYLPDFVNTYWLVPVQPCWDVLKEAARHTWNYIVQVIPYDNEATMFFGHPDQLYYYTRGDDRKMALWRRLAQKSRRESLQKVVTSIVGDFVQSEIRRQGSKKFGFLYTIKSMPFGFHNLQVGRAGSHLGFGEHGKVTWKISTRSEKLSITQDSDFLSRLAWTVDSPKLLWGYTTGEKRSIATAKLTYRFVESLILPAALSEGLEKEVGIDIDDLFTYTREGGTVSDVARQRILKSDYPLQAYYKLTDQIDGDPIAILYSLMFGMDPDRMNQRWGSYKSDTMVLLSKNFDQMKNTILNSETRNSNITLEDVSGRARRKGVGDEDTLEKLKTLVVTMKQKLSGPTDGWVEVTSSHLSGRSFYKLVDGPGGAFAHREKVHLLRELNQLGPLLSAMRSKSRNVARLRGLYAELTKARGTGDTQIYRGQSGFFGGGDVGYFVHPENRYGDNFRFASAMLSQMLSVLVQMSKSLREDSDIEGLKEDDLFPIYDLDPSTSVGDILEDYGPLIKAFIYFLEKFVDKQGGSKEAAFKTQEPGYGVEASVVAPNLKTFRVHHYVSSDKDILANNIVASTAQMWNTVVINHPASDPSDVSDAGGVNNFRRGTRVSGSASWVYWPPTKVSKVIGMQFHPGLTITNKKLRVFTELNCVTPPLAAKLASNRLAEGMRRMYTGTLAIRGRIIKPWDRVILSDKYTGMRGPLEVETVIHHFSPEIGWVTNIKPCAVCDSNPGSAAIQTAINEAAFNSRLNTVEWAFFGINVLLIPFTGGASSIGAAALRSTFRGVLPAAGKALFIGAPKATVMSGAKSLLKLGQKTMQSGVRAIGNAGISANPLAIASHVATKYSLGKVGSRLLGSYLLESVGKSALHWVGLTTTMHSWVEGHEDAEALPVVLSPLMFNGTPWTAGVESDEALFTVPLYNFYYSFAHLMTALHDAANMNFSLPPDF
jgi:hypothetical protein